MSPDRLDLWARFHRHGHETKGWRPEAAGTEPGILLQNPFPTEEWTYYLGDRLIAVSYVDALPAGLSAIYCYYDPNEKARSLGTLNILTMIAVAAQRQLPYVYLGYYVGGCRSLEYKATFRPNEVLRADGGWRAFVGDRAGEVSPWRRRQESPSSGQERRSMIDGCGELQRPRHGVSILKPLR